MSESYQGYPYVKPHVIDVPTLDPGTANRWTNLPRRQVKPPSINVTKKNEDSRNVEPKTQEEQTQSREEKRNSIDDNPVIYIDLPNDRTENQEPVENEDDFTHGTIFYDPFEDRHISPGSSGPGTPKPAPPCRPAPPQSSDIAGTSGLDPARLPRPVAPSRLTPDAIQQSSNSPSSSGYSPGIPPFYNKETMIYGQRDDFSLSPLPVSDFPEPPPAYSEIDGSPQTEQPRTQVILPPDPSNVIGAANPTRKYLKCSNCGMRVHTLTVKQAGFLTHLIAILFLISCIFPIAICIYCTDPCKYRYHYCPNCNQRIAYELPLPCRNLFPVNGNDIHAV